MRRARRIVKWASLLLLLLFVVGLGFGLMMRGMDHSGQTTAWSVCVDIAPGLFFFSYMFWFATSRRIDALRVLTGLAAVGWLVYWMALSSSFPEITDPTAWFWIAIFAPFVLYWMLVVCFFRKTYETVA